MSDAVSGIGAKFRRYENSVPEDIAEVISIDGPNKSRETIDVTSFDSTDGYREFIGSLRDAGEVSFEAIFTRDGYDLLNGDFEAEALVDYEILLPDAENSSFDFSGLVTALGTAIALDDAIKMSVTIKISGTIEVDSGSG